MKKNIFVWLAVLGLCVTACEKELDTYAGESGIYFDTKDILLDTIRVSWGLKNTEVREQPIDLKVCLYGNTADYDRKFNIEVATEPGDKSGAVEDVDYRAFAREYVIPANQAEALIRIDLLRTDELKRQPKRFTVKLVENDELHFIYTREINVSEDPEKEELRPLDYQRVIYMDESLPIPSWWIVYGEKYFGTWSPTKGTLICDVMQIDREDFVGYELTEGYLKFAGKYMHHWLQENPQLDEDGEPMEMGDASKG